MAYNCVPKHNDMVQNGTVAPLAVAKRCYVDHYDITLNFIIIDRPGLFKYIFKLNHEFRL
jgi:hypothetical protein